MSFAIKEGDVAAIWSKLQQVVETIEDAAVKKEVLALIAFEKKKVATRYKFPSAPFDILDKKARGIDGDSKTSDNVNSAYNRFVYLVDRLKKKTYTNDAKDIEDIISQLQDVFSLRKLKIYGQEVPLKEIPFDEEYSVDVVAKILYRLGKKYLDIHWTSTEKLFQVQVFDKDDNIFYNKKTPRSGLQIPISGKGDVLKVKVAVHTTENSPDMSKVTAQRILAPDEDLTIHKHRMNPSNSLYEVDAFRISICDKYKTVYDLFHLLNIDKTKTFKQACGLLFGEVRKVNVKSQLRVPWEYLKIPVVWNSLSYKEKVLSIVQDQIEAGLKRSTYISAKIETLYDSSLINKPFAYDTAKGGSQRTIGQKRQLISTDHTQLASSFINEGLKYNAMHEKDLVENAAWPKSIRFFKKNSVIYGKEYEEFVYLDTRLEREACATLRRIDRVLRLSKERGYPVLEKNVANPYPHTMTSSTQRMTTFGVNNYDRHRGLPAVERAPLVLASDSDLPSSVETIEDPQEVFDKRGMVKASKTVRVITAKSGSSNDIYYNHPIYNSKQKKNSWLRISSGR